MFLHVEESNAGAVELYSKEGYARADVLDSSVRNMDKMLRLVLQVRNWPSKMVVKIGIGLLRWFQKGIGILR